MDCGEKKRKSPWDVLNAFSHPAARPHAQAAIGRSTPANHNLRIVGEPMQTSSPGEVCGPSGQLAKCGRRSIEFYGGKRRFDLSSGWCFIIHPTLERLPDHRGQGKNYRGKFVIFGFAPVVARHSNALRVDGVLVPARLGTCSLNPPYPNITTPSATPRQRLLRGSDACSERPCGFRTAFAGEGVSIYDIRRSNRNPFQNAREARK